MMAGDIALDNAKYDNDRWPVWKTFQQEKGLSGRLPTC